ncbi:hypothetical protein HHI36_004460 [Cryptolaemus montrouzieri]|uniref:Uncharacterized protein n=1 Tax=Cryptolaemus montrouzieri TaxID=559131 RepID=A0ABD2NS22_9CUCU
MSQVVTYRERRQVVARAYAPGGCPIHVGKQKCGETKGLDIIMDFHKLYEEKMSEIDVSAGGDNLQEKVDLQQEWINDLTEQNKMLAKVIEELEIEAIGRVQQLEDKLKNAAKSFGEDGNTAIDDGRKAAQDGNKPIQNNDRKILEREESLKKLPIATENLKEKSDENDRLKQGIENMLSACTDEIASKHDTISMLRREIHKLEEKNAETEREAMLKNDIIRELRKELKKTKLKLTGADAKERAKSSFRSQVPTTDEKATNTTETPEFITINHSTNPEVSNNSTIIFIHKGQKEEKNDPRAIFDSSDSSECGLNDAMNVTNRGLVHYCRSENDIKQINWIRPTKERSKLTRIHKNDGGDRRCYEQDRDRRFSSKRLNIPKHIPVKTYVNNIEYIQEAE